MTKVVSEQASRAAMKTADTVDSAKIVKEVAALHKRKSEILLELARIGGRIARREEKLAS
jgi:hypothetical protein